MPLLAAMLGTTPAAANGDRLYLDCPCEIQSDGSTLRVTSGEREIELVLYERDGESLAVRERVRMETPVVLSGAFEVADLDDLRGTDPSDLESAPGPSMIDVLALYSQVFEDFHDGDATTRIQHVVTLANNIYRDSNLGIRLRLVGTVPVQVDESERLVSLDVEFRQAERDRMDLSDRNLGTSITREGTFAALD